MTENTPIKKEQLGPYKMTVSWLPLTDEATRTKAIEILAVIANDVDRSADFELECVQAITFERV